MRVRYAVFKLGGVAFSALALIVIITPYLFQKRSEMCGCLPRVPNVPHNLERAM